ncbi:MAG: hypothetical protein IJY25_03780 [Bacilli bacterium]|nr:hypothetical protein [Bacilli bacterium]MBQ9072253.1 hypothetical protein [Bacilli bacterium]
MDSFKQFQELISNINIDPVIAIGVIVIIATFIIEFVLVSKGYLNFGNSKKKLDKAVKLNHQIKAKRISYYDDDVTGTQVDSWYHAKYEYTLNNKKKIYRYLSRKQPPLILNLYYVNNPRKVFHYEDKKSSILDLLIYIIPFALGILIINLLK